MSAPPAADVTETHLLGGRVICFQPARGYRTAIDAMLLAAAVPAGAGERALELGTGVGAAAFALAARVAGARVTALEREPSLADLARRGVAANGFEDRVEIVTGDLLDPPPDLPGGGFDHVYANPPYMPAGRGNPSPDPIKAAATVEGRAKLADWLAFAAVMTRAGGSVTMIHLAEREGEVLRGLAAADCGGAEVLPVVPKPGGPAKRVIVRAWKGRAGAARRHPDLVVHVPGDDDGKGHRPAYSAAAEKVLRDAESLL